MNPIMAVLMTVSLEDDGELRGRTLLQKKLYFLSVLMGASFEFRPHYYGPYSNLVAASVDDLVASGFLQQKTEVFTSENAFGEVVRYSYSLTDDGRHLLKSKGRQVEFKKWRSALRRINKLNIAADFNLLSIAAKIYFIVSERGRASREEIEEVGRKLGWTIRPADIAKVISDLQELDLVSTVTSR